MTTLTKTKRIRARLLSAAVLALTLSSCSGMGRTVIEVEMNDGSWRMNPTELGDEEVTFKFANTGSQAHQPVVILTSLPADELPVVDGSVHLANIHIFWPGEGDFADWPPEDWTEDMLQVIEPGQTVEATPRKAGEGNPGLGTYVVFCYLPGHYERGEFGVFQLRDGTS